MEAVLENMSHTQMILDGRSGWNIHLWTFEMSLACVFAVLTCGNKNLWVYLYLFDITLLRMYEEPVRSFILC